MTDTARTPTSCCRRRRSSRATTSRSRLRPIRLRLGKPVIEAVGESRPTRTCSAICSSASISIEAGEPSDELEEMLDVLAQPAAGDRRRPARHRRRDRRSAAGPIQFVDVLPMTHDGKVGSVPGALDAEAPAGLYGYQPIRRHRAYPLALISPASERTISSTLAELPRPEVRLLMHPEDAEARGLKDGDAVRLFNELGEVRCNLQVGLDPPGHRRAAERAVAEAHGERLYGKCARPRYAHRPRRRRLLQRRPRAGRTRIRLITATSNIRPGPPSVSPSDSTRSGDCSDRRPPQRAAVVEIRRVIDETTQRGRPILSGALFAAYAGSSDLDG